MKKVIVIDWLDKYGGAERVIKYLDQVFKFDKMYTLVNIMEEIDLKKLKNNRSIPIVNTKLNFFGKKFRWLYFTFFYFIKKIKIDEDSKLIVSSSHCVAKGIKKTSENQIHISYFQHRNNNYIWDETKNYLGFFRYILFPFILILRKLDYKQAQNPDYIISNSIFVQKWVKETYNRDSVVIYPPVDFKDFNFDENKEDYYIAIGRLATIKRFDIIIKAFNLNKKKLYIIGDGEESDKLKELANTNITFLGFLESKEINNYLKKSKGFIQMGIEGFGIAPLESQYCGTPIIGYGKGALLETVLDKKTGIFFYEQTVESLNNSIEEFEKLSFDYKFIHLHAKNFSLDSFKKNILKFYIKITNTINNEIL